MLKNALYLSVLDKSKSEIKKIMLCERGIGIRRKAKNEQVMDR